MAISLEEQISNLEVELSILKKKLEKEKSKIPDSEFSELIEEYRGFSQIKQVTSYGINIDIHLFPILDKGLCINDITLTEGESNELAKKLLEQFCLDDIVDILNLNKYTHSDKYKSFINKVNEAIDKYQDFSWEDLDE